MSRLMVRQLPDGRRGELLEVSGDVVRVVFYTAEPHRAYASQDYETVAAARAALSSWDGGDEPSESRDWRGEAR